MIKKKNNVQDALQGIENDMTIMLGGFGLGIPENFYRRISKKRNDNLTCISNNAGVDDFGLALLQNVKLKMISSMLEKMPNLNAKCYLENSKLILFHKGLAAAQHS
jgi:3-oxoacid CoA-transferase subunit A